MFQEAMKTIGEVEARVQVMRQEAAAGAKEAIEAARQAGEDRVRAAILQAEAECEEMMRDAEQKTAAQVVALASNTENKKAVIQARAESAMDRAVALIIERIGGG